MNRALIVIFSLLIACLSGGCGSKSVESSPEDVPLGTKTVAEKMAFKKSSDSTLIGIESSVNGVKGLVELIEKSKGVTAMSPTPFSLIVELVRKLRASMPVEADGALIRFTKVKAGASNQCAWDQVALATDLTAASMNTSTSVLTLKFKSCGASEFQNLAKFNVSSKSIDIDIDENALKPMNNAVVDRLAQLAKTKTKCSVGYNGEQKIDAILCDGISVELEPGREMSLTDVSFQTSGESRLSATTELRIDGKKTVSQSFTLLANGTITVTELTSAPSAAPPVSPSKQPQVVKP